MNGANAQPVRSARRRRWWVWLLCLAVLLFVAGELVLRFYVGLGTPILYDAHPTIEYLPRPNQTGERFGNRYAINRYGMRSEDFPPQKTVTDELRLLVLGDSVLFGGSHTDQADLPTEIAARRLREHFANKDGDASVCVANLSAGSWGPPNHLAFLEEHGLLDADAVVLVLSSHDADDVPDFTPVGDWPADRPHRQPWLATTELLGRVFDRIRSRLAENDEPPPGVHRHESEDDAALPALNALATLCRDAGVPVGVVLYQRRTEVLSGEPEPGYALLLDWSTMQQSAGAVATVTETADRFSAEPQLPFRDDWHPNQTGHEILGTLIADAVLEMIDAKPDAGQSAE